MNFFEAQEFIKKVNPGKDIKFEFDKQCVRTIEFIFSNGEPHEIPHVQYEKIKITIEKQEPMYIQISPHRVTLSYDQARDLV